MIQLKKFFLRYKKIFSHKKFSIRFFSNNILKTFFETFNLSNIVMARSLDIMILNRSFDIHWIALKNFESQKSN